MTPSRTFEAARRHTIVVQLHDRPGALDRVIGLVRRRDYRVSSFTVGPSARAGTIRIVLTVEANDPRQPVQQLMRLVDAVSVREMAAEDALVRETVLAVVAHDGDEAAVVDAAARAGARVSHRGDTRLLLELTTDPAAVDEFVTTMRGFDLRELARTGPVAIHDASASGRPNAAPDHSPPILTAQELPR